MAWLREVAEHDAERFGSEIGDALPLVDALQRVRDEVATVLMLRHRGNSRELSFVLARLDEARGWAILYGESINSHVVIPKADILRAALEGGSDVAA